jgi:hypothetical protein
VFGAPVTLTFVLPGAVSVDCGDKIPALLSAIGVVAVSSLSSNILPAKKVPILPNTSGTPYNNAILHAYLSALYFII